MTTESPTRMVSALFDIKSGKPGCVLQQAVYGGDRSVCQLFADWEVNHTESLTMITDTWENWKRVAAMSPAERKNLLAKPRKEK